MKTPFSELYKGYLLHCQPRETPDGKYLSHLVISFAQGPAEEDHAVSIDHPPFDSRRPAADLSLSIGKKWVDARE